jgi:hypothetical protein
MDVPKSPSNYLKLEEGTVKVRVLSDFIQGFIDRVEKKPVYYRAEDCPKTAVNPEGFLYFRSCVVWNYDEKKLQAREIKSKQIMNKIKSLSADTDWGPDLDYDLKITKT